MERWLKENLVCPDDYTKVQLKGDVLVCAAGHRYPFVDDVPIMLSQDAQATYQSWNDKFRRMPSTHCEKELLHGSTSQDAVDPFVQQAIAATNGQMYRPLIGKLTRYPIPELPLPPGPEKHFLDIGCNWGRWCISAAQKGYSVVGVDPSWEAIRAARRVAQQLGVTVTYVVADASRLPFEQSAFDVVFSYSVLQHLEKEEAKQSLSGVARALKVSGICMIQLPNLFGLRSLYNRSKRAFRERTPFEVNYYTPSELKKIFGTLIGPTSLSVDGYFSLNAQLTDRDLLPLAYRLVVTSSTILRKISERVPWMIYVADSLYVMSIREPR